MCLTTLLNPCTPLSTPISPSANCTMLTQTPLLTLCHCTSPSCLITLSLILFAHIWLALSVNLSHPIHLPIKTSTLLLWFKGSLWWFSTPGQQKPPLTLDDLYNHLSRFLSHNNMLSCSLPCSFVGFFDLLCLWELTQPATSSLHSATKTSWRHDVCLHFDFLLLHHPSVQDCCDIWGQSGCHSKEHNCSWSICGPQ